MLETAGIHHISAMVNDAQRTVTFYTGILGVRLVKKTVNYARPDGYHLYFGNDAGEPGSIITFFPSANQLRGRIGTGQVGGISFQIPEGASTFWEKRLARFQIAFTTSLRFGERYIKFDDPDGLPIELVEQREGPRDLMGFGPLDPEVAITGLAGATLLSRQPEQTAAMLEGVLGLKKFGQERDVLRFQGGAEAGNRIDIDLTAEVRGLMGAGTIHHLAWRRAMKLRLMTGGRSLTTEAIIRRRFMTGLILKHFIFMRVVASYLKSPLTLLVLLSMSIGISLVKG
ncbi:VOC family protein [Halalkalibacter oceani]|uniref:VOC family protein n=1 Tax=Halalkalibacter oceani TaxID=1653776 RepID=UPI003D9CB766